ncbi:multidrug resistance-associated ABC transporter [Cylindrobasidium torrendii FP15055 ss-10]|uniref:Multidrug resistance-associated ABC transporter n=1 Tax=Cylindrobasidium torrendii FP15055 ss-10 TaxID=1314674 RepID=A0A0D7BJD2_9AGAR|nr:multidrug resistance-associated ABC transporter [Cylindrobasidium torrendii FP15055 ss-10]
MADFPVEVAAALTVCAVVSSLAFVAFREKEGRIQLPIHGPKDEAESPDPFDVARPIDFQDGIAIDEPGFWRQVRLRKLWLSIILSANLILESVRLGWVIIEEDEIVTHVIRAAFALYVLLVAINSVSQVSVHHHDRSITHLALLNGAATLILLVASIVPTSPMPVISSVAGNLLGIHVAVLIFYLTSTLLAMTTPTGPVLHFDAEDMYMPKDVAAMTNMDYANVSGATGCSPWDTLFFSYSTKVVMLGNTAESVEIADLPIVPAFLRATTNYTGMRKTVRTVSLKIRNWQPQPGSGWNLAYRIIHLNSTVLIAEISLAAVSAILFYVPPMFLEQFIKYLEGDPTRSDTRWGWALAVGLISSKAFSYLLTGQLWSLATTVVQTNIRLQLNSILFVKTLVRKDVASSAPTKDNDKDGSQKDGDGSDDEDDFSSKAQVMNLMFTDTDRISEFAWHLFTLIDSPIEIVIGAMFLYKLLGVSCFFGLAVTCLFLPLNHFAGVVVVRVQDNLMKSRDKRIALMNEILGAIRMLKFMAWERNFEAKVLKIREQELKCQRLNYTMETLWNAIWNGSPILVTLVSFWHFAVVRKEELTPSIAFTSIVVFNELKFALNALPETFINLLQSMVSLRRIDKYLNSPEITPVPPREQQSDQVAFQSCTITWPQDRSRSSATPSATSTPHHKFVLVDLSLRFPKGELSLVCGKLGSGKTLLLHALLGEADVLSGQMFCPRSPPDALANLMTYKPGQEWIADGVCAYVPQAAWLRNASIKENILFNLPLEEERYRKTLEACALIVDLDILEDGDESEIGERGVNLSGGQKARISLARAVYSRASILLLDDVLSAVDAHTAHHLYNHCLKGELMQGRTVILVSHHVQLCAEGAQYIVALDNGRVKFEGTQAAFYASGVLRTLVQSGFIDDKDVEVDRLEEEVFDKEDEQPASETSSTAAVTATPSESATAVTDLPTPATKKPRKLVEDETRAVGHISTDVWLMYIQSCGHWFYWALFALIFILGCLAPVAENGWLRYWSHSVLEKDGSRTPLYYICIYAMITALGLVITTLRWFVLYTGSIHASVVLYERLLESVLFTSIRWHDTVNRGRVLNRFGKDFEGIDSNLSDNFGRSVMYGMSSVTTLVTICVVGGWQFIIPAIALGGLYYNTARVYSQTSRDMRRLDSTTRSPILGMYSETIAGVAIIRAFGASSKFLRDMLRCVDTNASPYYWMWGLNRWLSIRFNILSVGATGAVAILGVLMPRWDASLIGFALVFTNSLPDDILFMVRRFVGLEQSMVALERVKEYSELPREPAEIIEPRPAQDWPAEGRVQVKDLVIRYAPNLPNVLHNISFEVKPGEKIGILGRTGSGKSTLALSFFRFVEPTEGHIVIDGLDISKIGLTDLRSKLTIIPQDPTILSGTLRSTLDVFEEYSDAEIFEALRRVHLIPATDSESPDSPDTVNANVFRNLDSTVSESGENFSTGEKQLLCMARAILKKTKLLVMDEATASVDYASDELIGRTIRHEFSQSTILTIAHRLRTIIDYDRIMLLDNGRIVEFDSPKKLLSNKDSQFSSLCAATGRDEFSVLKKMAGL